MFRTVTYRIISVLPNRSIIKFVLINRSVLIFCLALNGQKISHDDNLTAFCVLIDRSWCLMELLDRSVHQFGIDRLYHYRFAFVGLSTPLNLSLWQLSTKSTAICVLQVAFLIKIIYLQVKKCNDHVLKIKTFFIN